MADPKEPQDEEEDSELSQIATLSAFDEASTRRLLAEQGVSEAFIESLAAQLRAQSQANQRLVQREQNRGIKEYRAAILEEMKLPPNTPLTGATKAEIRRSAQAQRAFVDSIAASLAPKPKTGGTSPKPEHPEEAEWGQVPGGATEVVTERPMPAWGAQKQAALGGSNRAAEARPSVASKEAILADIMEHGAPRIARPSFSTILARGENSKA